MKHAFSISSPRGREIRRRDISSRKEDEAAVIDAELINEKWCEIRYHKCLHDEKKPCPKWEVITVRGDVPNISKEEAKEVI